MIADLHCPACEATALRVEVNAQVRVQAVAPSLADMEAARRACGTFLVVRASCRSCGVVSAILLVPARVRT